MKRRDLLELMPKNKSDAESASAMVELGYPTVAPVLRDMLLWLRVHDSSVADVFTKFFAKLTPRPVELIAKHIGTRSGTLRNRILVDILSEWPTDAVVPLSLKLTTLATHADLWNNDLECFRLILRHGLAEKTWVKQWLGFRKEQALERVHEFETLEKTIR